MSRRTKRQWSFREADRLMRSNGYKCVRQNGDHFIYANGEGVVSIPHSPNAMMMRRLIKEHKLFASKGNENAEREMKL